MKKLLLEIPYPDESARHYFNVKLIENNEVSWENLHLNEKLESLSFHQFFFNFIFHTKFDSKLETLRNLKELSFYSCIFVEYESKTSPWNLPNLQTLTLSNVANLKLAVT